MARIVGAFGVPHNPHFPGWSQQGAPLGAEIDRLYGEVRQRLEAVRPDVLVAFTSDHYNIFFEQSLPIFSIGVADSAWGASDYPTLPRRRLPVASSLARTIQHHLVAADFDVGMSQEFEFDHSVIAPLCFLLPERELPLVPIFVSGFVRPLPSAARCRALGGAVRRAVQAADGPARVAVLASGSFSLEIGGPCLAPESHVGVPDPAWTERVMELLRSGDVGTLVAEATDEQLQRAGNAGGEVLDWIAMLGSIDPGAPDFLEAQPAFGHAYGAWPLDVVKAGAR